MVIRKTKTADNPYGPRARPDDQGAATRIAFEIIAERSDLLPSVDRIMNADLDDDAVLRAITLFRNSLREPGDPHRDPRVAIAASTSTQNDPTAAPPGLIV